MKLSDILLLFVLVASSSVVQCQFGFLNFGDNLLNSRPTASATSTLVSGPGSLVAATGSAVDDTTSVGLAGGAFQSSEADGSFLAGGTSTSATRGSSDGASSSSSSGILGDGVLSASLFSGSVANEDGSALAFGGSSGKTTGSLAVSSKSKVVGGQPPKQRAPAPPDCSIVQYCKACKADPNAPRGIRCTSCSGGRTPTSDGNVCKLPSSGDGSGKGKPPPDCSVISYCTHCKENHNRPRGIRCTSCGGGRTLSGDGNYCNLLSDPGKTNGGGPTVKPPKRPKHPKSPKKGPKRPKGKGKKGKGKKGGKGPGRGGPGRGGPGRGGPGRRG